MSKKNLFAAAIIVIVLLVGSNIYFIAQSSRLSTQLVQVSAGGRGPCPEYLRAEQKQPEVLRDVLPLFGRILNRAK